MRVTVTTDDGVEHVHDIDTSTDGLSMQQLVKLEKVLGADRTAAIMGARGERVAMSTAVLPSTLRAILYVQLCDLMPDAGLKLADFDVTFADMAAAGQTNDDTEPADDEPVVLPMERPDGVVVQGESVSVDPTRPAATG